MNYISENKRGIFATALTVLVIAMLYLSFPATAYTISGISSLSTYSVGQRALVNISIDKTAIPTRGEVVGKVSLALRTATASIANYTFDLAADCTPNVTDGSYAYGMGYTYSYDDPTNTGNGYGLGEALSFTCNYTSPTLSTTGSYYVDVSVNDVYNATDVVHFTVSSAAATAGTYPTATPTPTATPSVTATPSASATPSATPTATPTATPSATPLPSPLPGDMGYDRDMNTSGNSTTFTLTFGNNGNGTVEGNFTETIPKEVAGNVSELTFDPAPTEIINPDPVVAWALTLAPGETKTVKYTVNKVLNRSILAQFSAPEVDVVTVATPTPSATAIASATATPKATTTPTKGAAFDWTMPIILLVVILAGGAYFYMKPKK